MFSVLNDELLLNSAALCFKKHKLLNSDFFSNILFILENYENVNDVIGIISIKISLCKHIINLRLKYNNADDIWKNLFIKNDDVVKQFIDDICKQIDLLTDEKIETLVEDITKIFIIFSSFGGVHCIKKFLTKFDNLQFSNLQQLYDEYSKFISHAYERLYYFHRFQLFKNDIFHEFIFANEYKDCLYENIKKNFQQKNLIYSGYPYLDDALSGGFQPGRLYIFCGASNDGKSSFLINLLKNQLLCDYKFTDLGQDKKNLFMFISLENFINESYLKFVSAYFKKHISEVIDWERDEFNSCYDKIMNVLDSKKIVINMKYLIAQKTLVNDLIYYLESYLSMHTDYQLRCIFIDYLDLLVPHEKNDLYRVYLGNIALELKNLAIHYSVPVVTLSQLNRQGYSSQDPDLTAMGESIKKVEHADFIGILKQIRNMPPDERRFFNLEDDEVLIKLIVRKNRSGVRDVVIPLVGKLSMSLIKPYEGDMQVWEEYLLKTSEKNATSGKEKVSTSNTNQDSVFFENKKEKKNKKTEKNVDPDDMFFR